MELLLLLELLLPLKLSCHWNFGMLWNTSMSFSDPFEPSEFIYEPIYEPINDMGTSEIPKCLHMHEETWKANGRDTY